MTVGMIGELCKNWNLKLSVRMSKGMMLEGLEGTVYEFNINWRQFEHASEFKYRDWDLCPIKARDEVAYRRKVADGRKALGVIRSPWSVTVHGFSMVGPFELVLI